MRRLFRLFSSKSRSSTKTNGKLNAQCIVSSENLISSFKKALQSKQFDTAVNLTQSLTGQDSVAVWNRCLDGFGGLGRIGNMDQLFNRFKSLQLSPNTETVRILVESYGSAGQLARMREITASVLDNPAIKLQPQTLQFIFKLHVSSPHHEGLLWAWERLVHANLANSQRFSELILGLVSCGESNLAKEKLTQHKNFSSISNINTLLSGLAALGGGTDAKHFARSLFSDIQRTLAPSPNTDSYNIMLKLALEEGKIDEFVAQYASLLASGNSPSCETVGLRVRYLAATQQNVDEIKSFHLLDSFVLLCLLEVFQARNDIAKVKEWSAIADTNKVVKSVAVYCKLLECYIAHSEYELVFETYLKCCAAHRHMLLTQVCVRACACVGSGAKSKYAWMAHKSTADLRCVCSHSPHWTC
jgi:hypothetical protein